VKRVTRSWTLAEIGLYRSVLEQNGIACLVKNEQLAGALGEVPFLECSPELWVLDDRDLPKAERLIEELTEPTTGSAWRCRHCGKDNDPEFGACWSCGQPDSNESDA